MPILGVLSKARVPVKIWSDITQVESGALDQLTNVANLPFVYQWVAAMPDVHFGMGATVGSVVATTDAVMPAAVGVDIGCGMMAVKTDADHLVVRNKIKELRHSIERSIPTGFNENKKSADVLGLFGELSDVGSKYADLAKAGRQLGTLGGGNHFIEICLDKDNCVWVMLHSGSRNIGKVLAEQHLRIAKELMQRYHIPLPDPNLAYLVDSDKTFQDYMIDLNWCQRYAAENREEMMRRVLKDLSYLVHGEPDKLMTFTKVNCHHNYIDRENHYGKNVLVTRKGAVRAREGDIGIIPGSMGTRSYIVRGLGNPESFHSCSHGAGRRMSRSAAKRQFTIDDVRAQTAGVECRQDSGIIDELPGAYKDIDVVMANQTDLVEIMCEIKQILCVKG